MRSTIRHILPLLLLIALALSLAGCAAEPPSAYSELYEHIEKTSGVGEALTISDEESPAQVFLYLQPATESAAETGSASTTSAPSDEKPTLHLSVLAYDNAGTYYRVDLTIEKANAADIRWVYSVVNAKGTRTARAESRLDLYHYTGDDLIAFDESEEIIPMVEQNHRLNATALTNTGLIALDQFLHETLERSVAELGFVNLAERYCYKAPDTDIGSDEDLGGAFSGARVSYALRMTLLGMGMVFAVLALLWLILLIFKRAMSKTADQPALAPKAPEAGKESMPVPASASAPAAGQDPALVAAITAAIAAMIESDPTLASQFPSGFRVVSFKRKSDRSSWTH